MNQPLTWAEIDLKAIAHNIFELKKHLRPDTRFMAVVKANAYGHGIIEISKWALQNGADYLAVARIREALSLREAGIDAPILIFEYTDPGETQRLIDFNLTQTVYDVTTAAAYARVAERLNKKLSVHIKIDTGMGRLGLLSSKLARGTELAQTLPATPCKENDPVISDILAISRFPGLALDGMYSHMATADSADKTCARRQNTAFQAILKETAQAGVRVPLVHMGNSAAIIELPETQFDMVRAGIALYGLRPSDEVDMSATQLKPAMAFKSRIIHLKKVGPGFSVSYGCTYQTKTVTRIATVAVGYADGYNRLFSSRGHMLVGGRKAPVIGRVCMDQTMLDVSHIPDVAIGDEVVVFGRQQDAVISADDLAVALNTINYEIVSTITARVPRIYI